MASTWPFHAANLDLTSTHLSRVTNDVHIAADFTFLVSIKSAGFSQVAKWAQNEALLGLLV